MDIVKMLIDEFKLKPFQVENTVELIDEGNTIPFIARYRKENTGDLSDITIRELHDRLEYLRNLKKRQEEVIRLIDEQEKLTESLEKDILKAKTLQRIEDLYRPYKKKRRTRAIIAKEKGLEPLANMIQLQMTKEGQLEELAASLIDEEKDVSTVEDAFAGAMDIIAEVVSDNAEYRDMIRAIVQKRGILETKAIDQKDDGKDDGKDDRKDVYEMYEDYKEPVKSIPDHRILAINRGEKEKFLRVYLILPDEEIIRKIKSQIIVDDLAESKTYLEESIEDSYKRLIFPSIEREIRTSLTERAEEEAIKVFALNLEPLLMQPPINDRVVMAIDPGFRSGCKLSITDDTGRLLDYATVYPTEPQSKIKETQETLKKLIEKHDVDIVAIGNGTASREVEKVVADMLKEIDGKTSYIIVNEAGASVYSASKVGQEEFPDLDVSIRGAVSIGRRLQDPLAELVKIDPKHIGVGQYQHDLNQKKLDESLKGVVEDSVNRVGVDLNTASPSLLSYVAGISSNVSTNLIEYRDEVGRFKTRKELLDVKGLGPKTYTQCAGFLRIPDGDNPLDNTGVHPESYNIAEKLYQMELDEADTLKLAEELEVGMLTLKDIVKELERPGRDPRDEMPKPILRTDVLEMEDLQADMVLKGTIRNVVDFGAFVDIGVKQDGLVHISHLSDSYIKHPKEVVKVGDVIDVRILDIDIDRGRISLSIKEV